MVSMRYILIIILTNLLLVKSERCFIEEKTCELDSSNLLEIFEDVEDIAQCKQMCNDNSLCKYFAYHDNELIPSHYHKCYVIEHCNMLVDFTGSIFGSTGLCTCSLEVQPMNGQLVNEIYAETEIECKQVCKANHDCEIYSFHQPTKDCELLRNVSTFEKSTVSGFHTGPGDCLNVEGFCKFSLLDSTSHQMVVSESKKMTVRSGMMDCKVNVSMVLIGMGGTCYVDMFDQCFKNAGGSGFVSRFFAILDPSKSINVTIDTDGTISFYTSKDGMIGQTTKGEDGTQRKGGNGYSGGGFGEYSDGGMDGGDSSGASGGKGQGIDIQELSSIHFALTPGPGQKGSSISPGGGAGVLINGQGPNVKTSYGEGKGYGNENVVGCALLEIIVK